MRGVILSSLDLNVMEVGLVLHGLLTSKATTGSYTEHVRRIEDSGAKIRQDTWLRNLLDARHNRDQGKSMEME